MEPNYVTFQVKVWVVIIFSLYRIQLESLQLYCLSTKKETEARVHTSWQNTSVLLERCCRASMYHLACVSNLGCSQLAISQTELRFRFKDAAFKFCSLITQ